MRVMTIAVLAFSGILTLGCDAKQAPPAAQPTARDQPATPSTPPAPQTKWAPNAARGWHVAVSGVDLPTQEGMIVMTMDSPGGIATYKLSGPGVMVSIDVRDAKVGQAGEWSPYQLTVSYMQAQWTCGMSSLNADEKLTLKVAKKGDGLRGDFYGDVTCAKVDGSERKKAKMTGWFEK